MHRMYYRIGDRVIIEKKRRGIPDIWSNISATICNILVNKGRFGFVFKLDSPDLNGNKRIVLATCDLWGPHKRLVRLEKDSIYPKCLKLKILRFKFF